MNPITQPGQTQGPSPLTPSTELPIGTTGYLLQWNGSAWVAVSISGAGIAGVTIPTVDNTIMRANGVAGAIQGSGVIVDDSNNLIIPISALLEFINTNAKISAASDGVLDIYATLLRLNQANPGDVQMPGDTYNVIPFTDGQSGFGDLSSLGYLWFTLTGTTTTYLACLRHTTSNTAGNDLVVSAGGATSGSTDKNGGQLVLRSGIATGSGGSGIDFYTSEPGGAGTTDRTQNNTLSIGSTGKVSKYKGVSTVSGGVPAEYATVDLTAQAAAIAATTIYAVPAAGAGMYRVSWVATITTVDATACSLGGATGLQVKYTDADDSVVKTSNPTTPTVSAVNATGTSISGCCIAYCKASTNLQYLFGYTATGGQMRYNLHIKVEYMG